MSFLTDLFEGNVGKAFTTDIAPQNIFKDFGSSFQNQPEWAKITELALPAVLTAGAALPALLPEGFAAAGLGAAAETGAPLDLLAGGEAAGTAGGGALSGLTASDVTFLDPTMFGEASAPGAVPPLPGGGSAIPFTDPASMGGQVAVGAPGGFSGTSVSEADWSTAASQPLIPSGGGAGPGAVAPSDFSAVQTAVDPGAPGLTGAGGGPGPVDLGRAVFSNGVQTGVEGVGPTAAGIQPGVMDQIGSAFGSIGSGIKTAAPWLGAAGLGYNLFQGYQSQQALKALQQQETDYQNRIAQAGQASLSAAGPMLATGEALMTGGTVPAPMQALLDNFRNSQRARIIQGYGARNQSTDPTQNSALAQDLNAVDNQMLALREQLGQQITDTANRMLASGASATQIAAELPMMMQRLDIQLQGITGNAIANFAAAMSGGTMKVAGQGGGINLNLNSPNTTNTQSLLGAP